MKHENVENEEAGRERSAYPYMSLKPAMKVTDAMKELGGARVEVQKNVLAHHLKEKEKSPVLLQRITSAKCYGLVEGRGAYKLTNLAQRFYFPTTESEKKQALLEMVSSPPCFGKLIAKFDGDKVPEKEVLGNILHREFGIPDSWKERVAGFFLSSVEAAGAMDGQGILRFALSRNGAMERPSLTVIDGKAAIAASQPEVTPPPPAAPTIQASPDANVHTIQRGDKIMRVQTPLAFDIAHWEQLNAYVQYLKTTVKEDAC